MRHFNPFAVGPYRNHYAALTPCFDPEDTGDGTGGGGADDLGGGGDEGTVDPLLASAHEFKDTNGYVKLPGFDKPVKLTDVVASIQSRDRHDGALKVMGTIAQNLKAERERGGRQPQQRPAQQPANKEVKSTLERMEEMDLLDGKTAAQAMREIQQGTLGPLTKVVVAMAQQLKEMREGYGTLAGERAETRFSGDISSVVSGLKLPKADGQEVLEEMVKDFYFSFDDEDRPRLNAATLSKEFSGRFKAMRTYFRNLEKATLADAQQKNKFKFQRPGAGTSANGKPQKLMSNRQYAEALFDGGSPAA